MTIRRLFVLCGAALLVPSAGNAQLKVKKGRVLTPTVKRTKWRLQTKVRLARPRSALRLKRLARPAPRAKAGLAPKTKVRLAPKAKVRLAPKTRPMRAGCSGGVCKPTARVVRSRGAGRLRVVAQVQPMSRRIYISRSRALLSRLSGRERKAAFKMIATARVRRNPAAQHAVLAYLKLRTMRGGRHLPLGMSQVRGLVTRRGWNGRQMANFALVLRQASVIAGREGISAKKAFDKALKLNGIYKRYYRGRCGA